MKTKVIHIDTETAWRGGQQQAIYLYEGMLKRGCDTIFVTKNGSATANYCQKNNLPCVELPMLGEIDLYSAWRISRLAKKDGYNVLHCHSGHSITLGLLAGFFNEKVKIVATRRVVFSIGKGFLHKAKYNSSRLEKIICISNAVKDVLESAGINPAKLDVITDGIDITKFVDSSRARVIDELNPMRNKLIIGTVAALEKDKDYFTLLESARQVLEQRKDILFVALGSGSLEEKLIEKTKQLGIADNFYFVGHKKNVGDYLKAFDIFVFASRNEGLGTSILDAESVGLPVVACRVGGVPEAVLDGENAILVERKNPRELAEALLELIDNPEKRKEFGSCSLEFVKKFDIKQTVEDNIELYKNILNGKSSLFENKKSDK